MEKTTLREMSKRVFFPAFLLSIFLVASASLFHLAKFSLLTKQLDFSTIPFLKSATLPFEVLLIAILLIASFYKPFEKIFRGTLITLASLVVVLIILLSFQEHLFLKEVPESLGSYKPLVLYWPIAFSYVTLSLLSFNLFSLFVWSFLNRLSTPSQGIKYFIPIVFVFGSVETIISNAVSAIKVGTFPIIPTLTCALIFMLCALLVLNLSWKRIPSHLLFPKNDSPQTRVRFPILSTAYLLAGCTMIKSFLDIFFKLQAYRHLPDPGSYSGFMANYAFTIGTTTLSVAFIWLLLGSWLLMQKGWKKTALYTTLSLLIGALLFLGLSSHYPFSWLRQGLFTGFLLATMRSMLFPLVQILYLHIPYKARFRTKMLTEMIALPLMNGLPTLILTISLLFSDNLNTALPYLNALIPILVLLLLLACKNAGKKVLGQSGT